MPDTIKTQTPPEDGAAREDFTEVAYLLRRADHETVAAIRSNDPRVFDSHAGMAKRYSLQSHALMAKLDDEIAD